MVVMLEDSIGADEGKDSAPSGVGGWSGLERQDHRVKTLATSTANEVSTASALCRGLSLASNPPFNAQLTVDTPQAGDAVGCVQRYPVGFREGYFSDEYCVSKNEQET